MVSATTHGPSAQQQLLGDESKKQYVIISFEIISNIKYYCSMLWLYNNCCMNFQKEKVRLFLAKSTYHPRFNMTEIPWKLHSLNLIVIYELWKWIYLVLRLIILNQKALRGDKWTPSGCGAIFLQTPFMGIFKGTQKRIPLKESKKDLH